VARFLVAARWARSQAFAVGLSGVRSSEPCVSSPEKIVFVGGAPRSGTSLTHALLCTAPGAGPYHPEISFFRDVPLAFRKGLDTWESHTSAFFSDPHDFRRFVGVTARQWLDRIAETLGNPALLAVKDPHLTPLFPEVHALLPDALFVTVCRHPYAVLRSRQLVHERSNPGTPFSVQQVAQIANEYAGAYNRLMDRDLRGKHMMLRYEDLNLPEVRDRLAGFVGVQGFDVGALWRERDGATHDPANPWLTSKYYGEIDIDPAVPELPTDWQDIMRATCAPIMGKMDYQP